MDVSSNKRYFIDLKANEALTGVTTRFTDNENFNNFEKKVETYVSKIFNSKNSKDDNSDIFNISFTRKKSNRSKSEKSENSSVSDIEDEKSKGISNEANSDNIIELPITILGKRWGIIGKLLPDKWLLYKWLRPTHMTYIEMKHIINKVKDQQALVMMFHSMEIMVGKTPYVRWKWMQNYYLFRLTKIIRYAKKKGFSF